MAQEFLRRTGRDPLLRRVFVPEAWEDEAESLLAQYHDQDFSYVDATSFVAMRRLAIQEALAFDHHFSIAGFALLGE
jgi:predicted nucleic acid-binding protein